MQNHHCLHRKHATYEHSAPTSFSTLELQLNIALIRGDVQYENNSKGFKVRELDLGRFEALLDKLGSALYVSHMHSTHAIPIYRRSDTIIF